MEKSLQNALVSLYDIPDWYLAQVVNGDKPSGETQLE